MATNTTPSASRPARLTATSAAGDNEHTPGPAADFWALLDELAARGRALRLQSEAEAARPEALASATTASAVGGVE